MSLYKRGSVWWMRYTAADGTVTRETTQCLSEAAAQVVLASRIREIEMQRVGAVPIDPRCARLPLDQMIDEYASELLAARRAPRWVLYVRGTLCTLRAQAVTIGELSPAAIQRWLLTHHGKGKTLNNRRGVAHAFCAWLVLKQRLPANPVEKVATARTDASVKRRPLSLAQLERLVEVAPAPRKLVYTVLAVTGLRPGEAAQLRKEHLMVQPSPRVRVPASISKRRTDEWVPLPPGVIDRLWEVAGPMLLPPIPSYREWTDDFNAAGIEPETAEGRACLYSLRHTLATQLLAHGTAPKIVQAIMRHSSLQLTTDLYGHSSAMPADEAMQGCDWAGSLVARLPPSIEPLPA